MKTLKDYISESYGYPMKGALKKGDDVVIVWVDQLPFAAIDKNAKSKIEKMEPAKVDKTFSHDNGRYSGDQHTWAYANDLRFVLWGKEATNGKFLGKLDDGYRKNPLDKAALLATPEQAEKLDDGNGYLTKVTNW